MLSTSKSFVEPLLTSSTSPKQTKLLNQNTEVKTEPTEQHFEPTDFESLPDLSEIVVCPSETGSNSYDCLLEAILLPIQYRDVFVGLRSPWKGGKCGIAINGIKMICRMN
jgi:hypothetical protein